MLREKYTKESIYDTPEGTLHNGHILPVIPFTRNYLHTRPTDKGGIPKITAEMKHLRGLGLHQHLDHL